MSGSFVNNASKVELYQLIFFDNFKTAHTLWGQIDVAIGISSADKEYFLLSNNLMQFSIQFRIKFTQSLINLPI